MGLTSLFVTVSFLFALSTLLLSARQLFGAHWNLLQEYILVFLASVAAVFLSVYCIDSNTAFLFIPVFFFCTLVAAYFLRAYTVTGAFFYMSNVLLTLVGVPWGFWFVSTLEVSLLTKILMLFTSPLLFLTLPFGIVQMVEQYDVLCRKQWKRPYGTARTASVPMVSIHIPTYAEPPEMVIETLNAVAQLQYSNFEVLVIDNNTKDETLWRPLEVHCKELGPRFRFFHVDSLAGAKAGALNFALEHTNPQAEIVGVIDADYHPKPNFISDLIGHFDDPKIGFVQTPHDYRAWSHNLYLTMCYFEYKAFFHTILKALNERDAALTIGTMCLLRKQAIIDAGKWATWCVTEDSELSIRIHNAGYSSVYVPEAYGYGLIPDHFIDYAKQRYRWIAGPVQELKHHLPIYLSSNVQKNKLTFLQRLHHFHHGFGSTLFALNIPLLLLSLALVSSMAIQGEIVAVPFALWISVTVLFATSILLQWLTYCVLLKTSISEMLLGLLANKSLTYVVNRAALNTCIDTNQKWLRTNKFKANYSFISALLATRVELVVGITLCVFAISIYMILPYEGLLTMCIIGLIYKGFDYLSAPIVAIISNVSQVRGSGSVTQKLFLRFKIHTLKFGLQAFAQNLRVLF